MAQLLPVRLVALEWIELNKIGCEGIVCLVVHSLQHFPAVQMDLLVLGDPLAHSPVNCGIFGNMQAFLLLPMCPPVQEHQIRQQRQPNHVDPEDRAVLQHLEFLADQRLHLVQHFLVVLSDPAKTTN